MMMHVVFTCFFVLVNEAPLILTLKPDLETVVNRFGYTLETHPVVTDDGYILGVHRVLQGKDKMTTRGPPVLLCHGLFQSSDSLLNEKWNYGYVLVDNGYDVWIHNYRGNIYSRKHTTLNPDSSEFHNFTFTEMSGDLKFTIDYVLQETGRQKLTFVGFSMGGGLFWGLGSIHPQYIDKVSLMVGVGVLGYPLSNTKSTFRDVLLVLDKTLNVVRMPEYKTPIRLVGPMVASFCKGWYLLGGGVCYIAGKISNTLLGGCDEECMINVLQVGTSNFSKKVLDHYFQMIKSSSMSMYDYGESTNKRLYGFKTPPQFDLSKITCPVYLIAGDADNMAPLEELEVLAGMLPTKPVIKIMKGYSHVNLLMNKQTVKKVMEELLKIIKAHHD